MNDKLKQLLATARYLAAIPDKQDMPFDALALKASIVAKGFIAEHPEDDEYPITVKWLESVGFVAYSHGMEIVACGFTLLFNSDHRWLLRGGYLPLQPHTRRDVRRLLAVLGIKTKE